MTTTNVVAKGGAGTRLPLGLAELIDPMGVEQFITEYWGRKHLIVRGGDPAKHADLLTLDDMDYLLDTCKVTSSDLRVVADGKETPVIELVSAESGNYANAVEALYDRYRKGATVNLLFVQEYWLPLSQMCKRLAEELCAQVHVNIYLTPPGTRGLTAHYDTHDVFVAQIFGTKRWKLYAPQLELPLRDQPFHSGASELGDAVEEFELAPGDLFYMPRGTLHEAASNESGSLHLTIGVQPVVWADLVRKAVERLTAKDPRFRKALPPGFGYDPSAQRQLVELAGDLIDAVREGVEPEALVREARSRAMLVVKPSLRGHLMDLEAAPSITLDTPVRRRSDIRWRRVDEDGLVGVEFHGKRVQFPGRLAEELDYVGQAGTLRGSDLPGGLNEAGRLVLLRRLLTEGFLTVVRPD